jgi:hypothetical protein
MGLDYKRERHVGSHHSSVDLLERESERARVYDFAPLPLLRGVSAPHLSADTKDATDAGDAELAEFVEFFTGAHRIVAPTTVQPTPQPSAGASRPSGSSMWRPYARSCVSPMFPGPCALA